MAEDQPDRRADEGEDERHDAEANKEPAISRKQVDPFHEFEGVGKPVKYRVQAIQMHRNPFRNCSCWGESASLREMGTIGKRGPIMVHVAERGYRSNRLELQWRNGESAPGGAVCTLPR